VAIVQFNDQEAKDAARAAFAAMAKAAYAAAKVHKITAARVLASKFGTAQDRLRWAARHEAASETWRNSAMVAIRQCKEIQEL
jgi:hypothetical protein